MLMTKIHPPNPIVWRGAERDRVAPEGFADAKAVPAIGEFALGLDLAHDIRGPILNGRQALGEGAGTGLIARGGDGQRQGFMGALQVIGVAPAIKVVLAVGQVLKLPLVEQFGFQGAMKPFVFAQGLRMRGAGMMAIPRRMHQTVRGVKGLPARSPHGAPLSMSRRAGNP